MKKISSLVLGSALCATLWSCSSDNAPEGPGAPVFKGDGYIAVQIRLPEVSSTRANDVFEDGDESEYTVNSCDIILFKGTDESNATVIGGSSLTHDGFSKTGKTDDNITSSSIEIAQISNLTLLENERLFGLVLINKPSDITYTESSLSVGSNQISSFSDFLSKTSEEKFYTEVNNTFSNFFMTNAILGNNKPGGGIDPTSNPGIFTLVNLTDQLYSTADEAKNHPAGCIYVERAVAKVTAENNITDNNVTIGGTDYSIQVEFALDNTEISSFIVRNVPSASEGLENFAWNFGNESVTDANNKYRMVGSKSMPALLVPLHTTEQKYYRTYWCSDPHYNTDLNNVSSSDSYLTRPSSLIFKNIKNGENRNPLYCHENTFTVANQTQDNTTRVVFKVTFKKEGESSAATFFTVNDATDNIYTSEKDAESLGNKEVLAYSGIKTALISALKTGASKPAETNMAKFVTIKYVRGNDGIRRITEISLNTQAQGYSDYFDSDSPGKFSGTAESYSDNKTVIDNIIEAVNNKYVIKEYSDGIGYYSELIRHFNDDGCPLPTGWIGTTVEQVYGNGTSSLSPNDYLGRYGVVRNNWYDISINSITGFGEPEVPQLKIDLSDDNNVDKKFMSVEIHTLSWAKRTQEVILQ